MLLLFSCCQIKMLLIGCMSRLLRLILWQSVTSNAPLKTQHHLCCPLAATSQLHRCLLASRDSCFHRGGEATNSALHWHHSHAFAEQGLQKTQQCFYCQLAAGSDCHRFLYVDFSAIVSSKPFDALDFAYSHQLKTPSKSQKHLNTHIICKYVFAGPSLP